MALTSKRLADWLEEKRNEQLLVERKKAYETIENLRREELKRMGFLDFYAKYQALVDLMHREYSTLKESNYEELQRTYYDGTGGLLEELATKRQFNGMAYADRNALELRSEAFISGREAAEEQIQAVKEEWNKLIQNVRARTKIKDALAYLHELGIDTSEAEQKYNKKPFMPPATFVDLSIISIDTEKTDDK